MCTKKTSYLQKTLELFHRVVTEIVETVAGVVTV